jgi:hypothetical protein
MTQKEIIDALAADDLLLTLLAEEIGERAMIEPLDSDATWETIGRDSINVLKDTPMGRGEA